MPRPSPIGPLAALLCLLGCLLSAPCPARGPDGGAAPGGGVVHGPPAAVPAVAPPAAPPAAVPVRVHGRVAFEVRAARGGASAAERAHAAEPILQQIVDGHEPLPKVSLEASPGSPGEVQLWLGDRALLTLGPADAATTGLAAGEYHSSLRAQVETFLQRERRRARLQEAVLSVSMVVFFGLCLLLGLRWVSRRGTEAQEWVVRKAATLGGLRVRRVTVLSPQAVESTAYLGLGAARVLAQVGLVYAYLAYTLSQFEATRGLVRPLTDLLASPFLVLVDRLGAALPAAVLLLAGVLLVRGLLRVVGFFFDHVARGEVRASWLPAGTASAARPLALVALSLLALLALGPLVSGRGDSVLTYAGLLALGVLGLAAVPMIAAVAVGAAAIFTGRFRPGEWVEIGPHCGEVTDVGFLDVTLVPVDAGRVRVPHLLGLVWVVRHLPGPPPLTLEVPVQPGRPAAEVAQVLERAAAPLSVGVEVRLVSLSAAAARYRIVLREPHRGAHAEALPAIAAALEAAGIPLG